METPRVRCWFLNSGKTELVQVQSDRLSHNWRKLESSEPYPRYPALRSAFARDLNVFESFVRESRLGAIRVTQSEVTYVNHIAVPHGHVFDLWGKWRPADNPGFLTDPDDAGINVRYSITGPAGEFQGRLTVTLQPAFRQKSAPVMKPEEIYVLTLTARGKPEKTTFESALDFLDRGREWITQAFVDITNPEMHSTWGRTR